MDCIAITKHRCQSAIILNAIWMASTRTRGTTINHFNWKNITVAFLLLYFPFSRIPQSLCYALFKTFHREQKCRGQEWYSYWTIFFTAGITMQLLYYHFFILSFTHIRSKVVYSNKWLFSGWFRCCFSIHLWIWIWIWIWMDGWKEKNHFVCTALLFSPLFHLSLAWFCYNGV